MAGVRKYGAKEFCIGILVLLLAMGLVFTRWGVSDGFPQAVSLWIIGTGTVLILIGFKAGTDDHMQCAVLYAAYLVRVGCMLVDIYGREHIKLLHSGADTESFYQGAAALYHGEENALILTRYPQMLNWIFHATGDNRVCVQYVNIVFWVLSCFVLLRLCSQFAVKECAKLWILLLWGFLPNGILLNSILLRESAEMFFDLWSFERFLYWMKDGGKRYLAEAFLIVIPPIILHSAPAALWAVYVAGVMFWDVKRQRFRWQIKSAVVFACAFLCFIAIIATPLKSLLFVYFGKDFSIYGLTHMYHEAGGSDYLGSVECSTWWQFSLYTLVRMFYFLFSPLPTEARGSLDIAAFLGDGFLLMLVILCLARKMYRNCKMRAYIGMALLGMVFLTDIFAWGVANAGTAMRHRYLVWGIMIMGLCISYSEKKRRTNF